MTEELTHATALEETLKDIIKAATGHDCGLGACRQARRAMPLFEAALAAETERCAQIAEQHHSLCSGCCRENIAAAIRDTGRRP